MNNYVFQNEIQKLDYETCNQLRFSFRENVHKYALVYLVFMSAYLAYGKYTINSVSRASINAQSQDVISTSLSSAENQSNGMEYQRFLTFIGILFGVGLSVSHYVGLRMYCRSRSLSVCAIRSQQLLRDQAKQKTSLLSGLKVISYRKLQAVIPHGISNGEYQIVVLLCLLSGIPIFLSYPFIDMFLSLGKDATISELAIWIWLLILEAFLFFSVYTAENTFGHLSEAEAINPVVRVPVFPKKWGSDSRDPGYRVFRKEWQRTFWVGYISLFLMLLTIVSRDSTSNAISRIIFLYNHLIIIILLGLCFHLSFRVISAMKKGNFKELFSWEINKIKKLKIQAKNNQVRVIRGILFLTFFGLIFLFRDAEDPFLKTAILCWKIIAAFLLIKIMILVIYKISRYHRLNLPLQFQAIYNSGKKYGIFRYGKRLNYDIDKFSLDIIGYRIFKKSWFTYKKCFDLEDCTEHGELFKKLIEHENHKKTKPFYKILMLFPKMNRMIRDCWNVNKIRDDLYESINMKKYNSEKVAIFFPNWFGDAVMTRGAIEIIKGLYDENVLCIPVLDESKKKTLLYSEDEVIVSPDIPNTSFKHAKYKFIINYFKKLKQNNDFICILDKESFRAAFFINRNYHLARKMKCPTYMFDENKLRDDLEKKGINRIHRVDCIKEFVANGFEKMGYKKNQEQRDGSKNYSLDRPNTFHPKANIGVFPFAFNHNKYKGWSVEKTIELIFRIKRKYNDSKLSHFLSGKIQ